MVEYGNGVGQASGGSGGGGGQSLDTGAAVGQVVGSAVHALSVMPPAQLALIVVAIIVGFVILKRAF